MGVIIVEGKGDEFGRPIVTCMDFAMQLFPNYFGQDLYWLYRQRCTAVAARYQSSTKENWLEHHGNDLIYIQPGSSLFGVCS